MSERLEFKGDYIGFSYGVTQPDGTERLTHSSTLGIVRTSDGSRFNENLLPTIQDKTVQVPGGDGTYFFGSYYTQRQFSVSFAFDSLTEEQIAEIRRVFGDKQIHDLIFDERPYKVYSAKVTGTATIKYIAFDEGATNRLYKGEGTIQFTCYYPFARCRFTNLADCQSYSNWKEWIEASQIATYDEESKQYVLNTNNFGDVPVPFTLELTAGNGTCAIGNIKWTDLPVVYEEAETSNGFKEGIIYYEKSKTGYEETKDSVPSAAKQYYIVGKVILNTKTGVVRGTDGNLYNKYVTGDLTVKIPVGETVEGAEFTCLYI